MEINELPNINNQILDKFNPVLINNKIFLSTISDTYSLIPVNVLEQYLLQALISRRN